MPAATLQPPVRRRPARQAILAAALLVLSLALLVWINLIYIMPLKRLDVPNPDNDLGVFWSGARTVWQGGNPYDYSPDRLYRQIAREAGGTADTFVNPFYITLIFMPLAALPLPWAGLVWLLGNQFMLGVSVALLLRLAGRRLTPGLLLAGLGLALVWRYSFEVMILNNISLLMLLSIVLSAWLSRTGRPVLAGAAAALLLLKPQITFLVLPLLLVAPAEVVDKPGHTGEAAWLNRATLRRWTGFGAAAAVLAAYSFLLRPGWLGEWLNAAGERYTARFDSEMTSVRSLAALFTADGRTNQPLYLALAGLLGVTALALWWQNRTDPESYPYLLSVVTGLNLLAAPYTRSYDYVMLLVPLLVGYFKTRELEQARPGADRPVRWSLLWWLPVAVAWPLHLLAVNTTFAWETLIPATLVGLTIVIWWRERRVASKGGYISGSGQPNRL